MYHLSRLDCYLDRPKLGCLDFTLYVFRNMTVDFMGNLGNLVGLGHFTTPYHTHSSIVDSYSFSEATLKFRHLI